MMKTDRFRVHPLWLFLIVFGAALIWGVFLLFELVFSPSADLDRRDLMLILCLPISLYYFPRCMWGYSLDCEYFTIYILWFPVKRIPWSEVSQVIYIHLGEAAQKKAAIWKKEYICVTINPAEPVPFFYHSELRNHWRRNIFLVWNLYFTNPEVEGSACIEAFESLGKTVEHRDYD